MIPIVSNDYEENFRQLMDFLGLELDFERMANEIGEGVEITMTEAAPFTLSIAQAEEF